MSFRSRVAGLVAIAVALAFLVASVAMFASTRRSLLSAVDSQLHEATEVESGAGPGNGAGLLALRDLIANRDRPGGGIVGRGGGFRGPEADAIRGLGIVQVLSPAGAVIATFPAEADPLPVDAVEVNQAMTVGTSSIHTVRTDDASYRVVVARAGQGAVQIARPINDIEEGLRGLVLRLALVSLLGVGLAFIAGGFVADRILVPVRRLTSTAELIAETQELAHRADESGDDELARLGGALNRMLTALDASRRAQQQLVADASHELRTPLTSLRTNVEVLASAASLTEADRSAMRADVIGQIEEMTILIGNLVDLAREGSEPAHLVEVALDELVEEVVERQQRLSPQVEITLESSPTTVLGEPERLRRAVANLVDNAVKYAGEAGPVEVSVAAGVVEVRDHGPGVSEADRVNVFGRFWRSPAARSASGSGLGLAIVAQVAADHGGSASVDEAPGGGARFRLTLPPTDG